MEQKSIESERGTWPKGGAPLTLKGKKLNLRFNTRAIRILEKMIGGSIASVSNGDSMGIDFLVKATTAGLTHEGLSESDVETAFDAMPEEYSDEGDNLVSLANKIGHALSSGMPGSPTQKKTTEG